jgi:hypothetical protein
MPDQIERALRRLGGQLSGRVSMPGEDGYAAATAIWAKPVGPLPRAVRHRLTTHDVRLSVAICGLPLSVQGGRHHWVDVIENKKGAWRQAVRFTKRDRHRRDGRRAAPRPRRRLAPESPSETTRC